MGQLLTVHTLLMIVLRELWNVTKVRETTIIINKIIYRKKKMCLGLTPVRDPLDDHICLQKDEKENKQTKKKKTKAAWP